ncbi:MAG: ribosome small subunit-dependent GTPase A [candidate division Zixibacteria bacterium]|nr:ribosome small subunit-dependent GTPase A [candidate division Zixibacteria bacterium]MDD5426384.1 ribosome small subunit-dependent GTPase A [candidate division Zixibacteria bacterium]
MNISQLGWNPFFNEHFNKLNNREFLPARVSLEHKDRYQIWCEQGEMMAEVSGRFRHEAQSRADFPVVGDWVAIASRLAENRATIHQLLPRKTIFSRKAILSGGMPDTGGKTDQQVLAANVDTVFLVSGLDGDYNVRRMERYMTVAWDSGARPVIVLNKVDLCPDIDDVIVEVQAIAFGVTILAISAFQNQGLETISQQLEAGKTAVFLGSSGVGKSTIINHLLGEERLKTKEVRAYDDRGRHTTTSREMLLLPSGGIVIDTPGLRELQLWDNETGLSRVFADIEELARHCRFRDCEHVNEPGCAVRTAINDGKLDAKRFENYLKMKKELRYLESRKDIKAQRQTEREFTRRIHKMLKEREDLKKKGLI